MERLTGKQAQSLAEAYAAVYTSQELTEEQVWEEVETIEEASDLEMGLGRKVLRDRDTQAAKPTPETANLKPSGKTAGGLVSLNKPYPSQLGGKKGEVTYQKSNDGEVVSKFREFGSEANPPSAADARKDEADSRRNQAPTRSSGSEANPPSAAEARKDEADPRRNLETGSRKSGESLADFAKRQSQNLEKDFPSTAATAERSTAAATPNTAGAPAKPSPTPSPSPAPSRSSSSATASTADKIKGGMDVYNKQRSSGDFKGASETGKSVWALANPKLAAAAAEKARIRGTSQSDNPLMKGMPGKRPMTPSVQSPTLAKDLGKGSGNQSLLDNPNASKAAATPAAGNTLSQTVTAASKPTAFSPTPAAGNTLSQTVTAASKPTAFSPTPAAKPATPKPSLQDTIKKNRGITSSFDLFDLVKGHLLDEGYAESEDAAMVIMANMSEEWRQSIVNENLGNFVRTAGEVIRNPIRAINSLGRDPNLTKRAPDDPRLVDVSTADKAARNLPGSRVYQQRQQQMNR